MLECPEGKWGRRVHSREEVFAELDTLTQHDIQARIAQHFYDDEKTELAELIST